MDYRVGWDALALKLELRPSVSGNINCNHKTRPAPDINSCLDVFLVKGGRWWGVMVVRTTAVGDRIRGRIYVMNVLMPSVHSGITYKNKSD